MNDRESQLTDEDKKSEQKVQDTIVSVPEKEPTEAEKQAILEEQMLQLKEEAKQLALKEEAIASRLRQMYKLKGKMDHRKISKSREIYSQLKLEKQTKLTSTEALL